MAQSFDVNINIGSELGFTIQKDASMLINTPQIQTTMNLNGEKFTTSSYSLSNGALMKVSAFTDFEFPIFTLSNSQTLYISNIGLSALTVTNILFSSNEDVSPVFYTEIPTPASPIIVAPGNTATMKIGYVAFAQGVYDNFIVLKSNNNSGAYYKINTHQIVGYSSGISVSPEVYTTTTTYINAPVIAEFRVTAIFNTVSYPTYFIPLTTKISGSTAWRVLSRRNNLVRVEFNPNEINNVNGTYSFTLDIGGNGAIKTVTGQAILNIDYGNNKHLASWLSPGSHYNSIIGISYDIEDSKKMITIGVGMGADTVPIYGEGGAVYSSSDNLCLGTGAGATPYPFWAKVYRIILTGAEKTYYSSNYSVKTTLGLDYSGYFGEYLAPGSMFIVEDDGYGTINIKINHLRDLDLYEISDSVKATLRNLTRAFYYYSNVDVLGRYEPLPDEYISPIIENTATTHLFLGFNYNVRDNVAFVNNSIVPLPI